MTEPIATRTLKLVRPDGTTTPIIAEIAKPEPVGDGPDHRCEYRVVGLARTIAGYAQGVDGLHALFLAMVHLGIRVRHSDEAHRGQVQWIEGEADLGFPPETCIAHLC